MTLKFPSFSSKHIYSKRDFIQNFQIQSMTFICDIVSSWNKIERFHDFMILTIKIPPKNLMTTLNKYDNGVIFILQHDFI